MKKLLKNLSFGPLVFILTALFSAQGYSVVAANSAQSKILSGNAVVVWQEVDINYNTIVQGGVGSLSNNPITWTITTLSDGISDVYNSIPNLYGNHNGDALVLWGFYDIDGFYWYAASILPSGSSKWTSAIISAVNDSATFNDVCGFIDESGNILATWTAYDATNNVTILKGATATVSSLTWSSPFTIAQ